MKYLYLGIIFLCATFLAKAQSVTYKVSYQKDSLQEAYTTWYNNSQSVKFDSTVQMRLDSFYNANKVDLRLRYKYATELKMVFNKTISSVDRIYIINRLIDNYTIIENEFPVFILIEERKNLLKK